MKNKFWGNKMMSGDTEKILLKENTGSVVEGTHIYFFEPVTQDSIANLISDIQELEREVKSVGLSYDMDPPPIHVHIHSYGGEIFAGFAAMDRILSSEIQIHTHIEGAAASAATFLSVAGAHRTIGKHGFIMIHQLSSVFWGRHEEFKEEMINQEVLMKTIREFYQEKSNMSNDQIEEILKKDLWFSAQEALDLGLVDEIV